MEKHKIVDGNEFMTNAVKVFIGFVVLVILAILIVT